MPSDLNRPKLKVHPRPPPVRLLSLEKEQLIPCNSLKRQKGLGGLIA